jgi:hypothetical protein
MNTQNSNNTALHTVEQNTSRLNDLNTMTVSQLQRCFFEVSGEVTNSKNKGSLRKRVEVLLRQQTEESDAESTENGQEIETEMQCADDSESSEIDAAHADETEQAEAEQTVSEESEEVDAVPANMDQDDIDDGEPGAATQPTIDDTDDTTDVEDVPGDAATEPTVSKTKSKPRDPRLPAPGAILVKQHKGEDHEIKVLDSGFEYRGDHYRSLSALAKKITGTTWNGFLFLDRALKAQREVQAAEQ